MHLLKNMIGITFTVLLALTAGFFLFAVVIPAEAADDLPKQIERKLSKVKREIPTSPSRAEKGWLEAREMLTQLENTDSGHAKIPALQKSIQQLGQKLEKRLGRPIGGSPPEVKKKDTAQKQKTTQKKKPTQTQKTVQKQKTAPAKLPSSVTSRLRKINTALDAVETSLTKNQLQSAETKLKTAHKTMDEIQKRYSSKIPAGNEEMKKATDRLAAVTGKVDQAKASAAEMAEAEGAMRKEKEAQSNEWVEKFSLFLDPKSDSYLLIGAQFNRASEEEQKKCREAYARANALMAEYKKVEFPHGKTTHLQSIEPGLIRTLNNYNKDQSRAQQEEASREWVDKLRAYVDVGSGSRKYLTTGVTADETGIKEQEALFREAQGVWSDYQKAEFPLGKSPRLVGLEEEMKERLAQMPEILRKSRALVAGDLEGEVDRVLAYLNKDTGWKNDTSKTPNIAMKRDVEPLHKALEKYASTVGKDDPKLATLKEKITQVEKTDQKNREIRADRTFMEPDRYKGKDADELRKMVSNIVKEKSPSILRVTLRAADWKEEEVVEWTDTTKTKARYRITKSMSAQAAAKGDDGKVYLHTVHLASDRKSDGSWGLLYGHIMWSDWMAEKNVNK